MVEVGPRLVVAAAVGLAVAAVVLRPYLTRAGVREAAPQLLAVGVAVVLIPPVLLTLVDQTRHFRDWGLTEVGSAAFEPPPMSDEAARALRDALEPGETWAVVTQDGACADLYAFYWLAFRLVPNDPDCEDADVQVVWDTEPQAGADLVARGDRYAVVRP